jgi:hypothetical protein
MAMVRWKAIEEESGRVARITDRLRDAVVELEVWRQNARSTEERQALHRITALLGQAVAELREGEVVRDPFQEHLPLSPAVIGPGTVKPAPASGRVTS